MHTDDHAEIQNHLQRPAHSFGTLKAITKFSDGKSNPAYRVTADAHPFMLRAKPLGNLPKPAYAVDREFRVTQALGCPDIALLPAAVAGL